MTQTPPKRLPLTAYQAQSPDTSIEADLFLFQKWREFPLWKKAELTTGVTKGCYKLCLAGIRHQYPQATPAQKRWEYVRRRLGREWADLVDKLGVDGELMIGDPITLAIQVAEIFDRLEIPYLVGGSVASSLLGEPRATLDVDMVADLTREKVPAFVTAVESQFYVSEQAVIDAMLYQSSFNLIHFETTEKVDIFLLSDQLLSQSKMSRRQRIPVTENADEFLYLPTPEDIILQKLICYRLGMSQSDRQWRDVLGVLKIQGEKLDFEYLDQWSETLKLTDMLAQALQEARL